MQSSTDHPLVGVIEKLKNADDHLHRLAAETRLYLSHQTNGSILSELDPHDKSRGNLKFHVLRQPPLKLAAIVGDVVHNLRCSLDYIVEELVKRNGHQPTFQHQFPICVDKNAFEQALKKGRLYGVHEKAVWAIEQFQPYHLSDAAQKRHPLKWLHILSNRDKHHVLAVSALNAELVWKFVTKDGRVLQEGRTDNAAQHGDVMASVPVEFVIEGERVQLQSKLSIAVGFNEPAFKNFDVTGSLQTIREFIGQFLVPAFATFFEPLPDHLQLTTHGIDPQKPVEMLLLVRPTDPASDKRS